MAEGGQGRLGLAVERHQRHARAAGALQLTTGAAALAQQQLVGAQDTRLDAYIGSQPGWRLVARFPDDASGATTERDGLQRALAAARAGLIDVLLVYRVDRFSRNLRDMVMLLDELDQAGVVFRSATEPFDTSTPMGRMLVQMLGMFAQFERDTIIDLTVWEQAQAILDARGESPRPAPTTCSPDGCGARSAVRP